MKMRYVSLQEDFKSVRDEYECLLNNVIDEAERYIIFLEGVEDRHHALLKKLNEIDASDCSYTKEQILSMVDAVLA